MRVLEFSNIHRAYRRGTDVLAGASFCVNAGEVVGLLGRNGAGKTTLMRIAMGMIEPQDGAVSVFGLDPRERPLEVKRRVGYVSEDQILPPYLRVREAVGLHRQLFPSWDEQLEGELRSRFDIPMEAKIKALSKGQARQVALLCAVSHRPELLLLDEPAGGLDPLARREFLETSIQLLNESGSAILFSSHYMTDVERLAGRIVMLHAGRVLIDSELDSLQEDYSVVLLPLDCDLPRDRLTSLDACMGVRRRRDALHAVFALPPDEARASLESELGVSGTQARSVPLEEMFVELMGGNS
jgi:ABC-2 type transport system ATP-binding protein